jgi:hypothetical protein
MTGRSRSRTAAELPGGGASSSPAAPRVSSAETSISRNSATPNFGAITIIDAVTHPAIWGSLWFSDRESWWPWFVVFKVVFGLPLDDRELALFRQCTGREAPPPADGFNEIWLVCGRRGGKSLALATIATFLAVFRDWSGSLAPGERGVVQILASDRSQARVIFRYVRGLLTRVPPLAAMIERETREAIDLTNGLTLEITTADRSG